MNDWEPGDPLYDESETQRVYNHNAMFDFRRELNANSWYKSARWNPIKGWHAHDER